MSAVAPVIRIPPVALPIGPGPSRLVMHIAAKAFLGSGVGERMGPDFFTEFHRFSDGIDPVLPGWLPLPHPSGAAGPRDRLRAAVGQMIQARREHPVDPPDFLQNLTDARYSDGGFTGRP